MSVPQPDIPLAGRLFAELRALSADPEGGVTRISYGPGEAAGHALVRREAEALDLRTETDAACNLYVTLPGRHRGPATMIGSHLDSVPQGGNYDGTAGVLLGLAVLAGFRSAGVLPPRAVTVAAFRAEESTWFPASYIGSRAAWGRLQREELARVRRISDGMSLGDAISAAGGDPAALAAGQAHLRREDVGLFVEPHIEQGPVLAEEGPALGIVTAIRGSLRHREARCAGREAHSGATPRPFRRDPVRAFAAFVTEADRLWSVREAAGEDLAVTFGKVSTDPARHAFSKVASHVDFALDVRSRSEVTLAAMGLALHGAAERIARDHRVRIDLGPSSGTRPATMHPAVVAALASAAEAACEPARHMPCGAGHDAAVFAETGVPTGMLFIRNRHGSHNPEEAMDLEDFARAAAVLSRLCLAPPAIP